MSHRVYITNQAIISCAGANTAKNLAAFEAGKSHFSQLEGLSAGILPEETRLELESLSQDSRTRGHDPVTKLALLAARQLQEARGEIPDSWACIIGSSRGATQSLEQGISAFYRQGTVDAKTSPVTTANSLPSAVARFLGLSGLHFSISAACSTGMHAAGVAFSFIRSGMLDGAIAGGSECAVTPFTLAMLNRTRVYTRKSATEDWPHCPLHPQRSGMVLGDGAALLTMERTPSQSGVEVLAYAGASESIGLTGVSPEGQALQLAIQRALKEANLSCDDIDFIVGHGASTSKGDDAELQCYKKVFGDNYPPLIFHKWLTGHTLGAAGAISLGLAAWHLQSGKLSFHPYFPQLDWENEKRYRGQLKTALVVSLGFGGNAAAMILRR